MSGDVQPRKRKDKKKKKDDLGIEEPRGTAAALGEGDVFMHSHHEHGTGGHWCAKVIFFSLLAVLVTLIGLIILENRGLSELEANSVESRYSGVLDGWIEEGHDDDHHDEHTLELHHHDDEDDDEDDHSAGVDHDDDDDGDDDDEEQSHEADDEDEDDERNQENDDDDEENRDDDEESNEGNNENDDDQDEADQEPADSQQDDDDDDDNQSEERNLDTAEDEDEDEEPSYRRYYRSAENQANDNDDDDDDQKASEKDDDQSQEDDDNDDDDNQKEDTNNESQENDDDDEEDDAKNVSQENDDDDDDEKNQFNTNEENDNSEENDQDEDDEDHIDHNDHNEDDDVELEHIEDEVFDDDVSTEAPAKRPEDSAEVSKEAAPVADADDDEVELLEPDDVDDLPEELPIPVPKGRPLVEVEDSSSSEKPQDTLADEEEYERQQEALRKEKEQASQGMWLKLVVGGALLVATHAVLRRATAPRENEDEVNTTREETPLSDRRMTLISEPVPPPVTPKPQEVTRPVVQKEVIRQTPVVKSAPPPPPEEEDEEEEIIVSKDVKEVTAEKETVDKELYSDEEELEEEEEEEKEEPPKPIPISKPITPTKEPPKPEPLKPIEKKEPPKVVEKEPTPEDDDDVEIIEEEDIDEDLEEEEEEISDVDDAELLTRLEAKYGRLPEPERPGRKKDGGNSIEDEWPGEPSDAFWRDELDHAERDLRQGSWSAAAERASAAKLRASARARYVVARALDSAAEAKRDNALLTKAIAAYLELLKMNEKLSNKKLVEVADRALDRMKFKGNYLGTEPVYRLLIRRFPEDPTHLNNLTISFLMANRVDLAEEVIKETLKLWPNDRLALAHRGFILKTLHNKLEEAIDAFSRALEGDTGPANEPRFYYHLGDALLLLGRFTEAHEVHKRGAKLGHFLSPAQRSLYNVERLKSQPWWDVDKTPYARLARALEKSWKDILKEGLAAQALYEKEKEGLKERGEWSQLDLFVRGREVPNRCSRAPVTCNIVRSEVAASGCRRGQVKFSLMEAGTHVRPHVGPTNCRLRMHLGLTNTKDTYLRVDKETRQWQTGKVLMFDDSFEHEVWHNGTGARLVLIVDVWHPDLTRAERAQLPAI